MSTSNNENKKYLEYFANFVSIIAPLSIFLYVYGLIYFKVYYSVLGINSKFLDFSSNDYIFKGGSEILNLVGITVFLPFFLKLRQVIRLQKNAETIEKEFEKKLEVDTGSTDSEFRELFINYKSKSKENLIFLNDLENYLNKRILFLQKIFMIVTALAVSLSCFFIYKENLRDAVRFIEYSIYFIIGNVIIKIAHVHILKNSSAFIIFNFIFSVLPLFLGVYLFLIPGLFGFFEGLTDLKIKDFQKVNIYTSVEDIKEVDLILYSKDIFFILRDKNLTLIPLAEVKKIENYKEELACFVKNKK